MLDLVHHDDGGDAGGLIDKLRFEFVLACTQIELQNIMVCG
jgi:hypothetical protein